MFEPGAPPDGLLRFAWAAASKRLMGWSGSVGAADGVLPAPPAAAGGGEVVFPGVPVAGRAEAGRGACCSCWMFSGIPVRRYSTARSGLKNAALMARSICERSKPMDSMFCIAESR